MAHTFFIHSVNYIGTHINTYLYRFKKEAFVKSGQLSALYCLQWLPFKSLYVTNCKSNKFKGQSITKMAAKGFSGFFRGAKVIINMIILLFKKSSGRCKCVYFIDDLLDLIITGFTYSVRRWLSRPTPENFFFVSHVLLWNRLFVCQMIVVFSSLDVYGVYWN